MKKQITFNLNGRQYTVSVDIRKSLLEMLRQDIGLAGTKEGCAVGECGACTVLIDGAAVDSCIYLAVWADKKTILTIEGVAKEGMLSDVQQSYIDVGAVQCGYCTPGLVLATTALLYKNGKPTHEEIRRGLSGNLCRCTGYAKIIEAVEKTVEARG